MATIAEKSRTKEIIDRLQMIMDTAPSAPLAAGKVTVYKDEVQSLLSELALQMDVELKTYHEVNDRKGKIISEAKKEAEQIILQAERSASRMRVSKHTTGVAPLDYNKLNDEERDALGNANEIYAASLIYTDEMLTEVTDMISDAYHNIRSDYEIIIQSLEEKLDIINNNRAELMDGLQEMDKDDRSQQILEIGQLLSNELYNSRMKARMDSDEYEDGSVQLTLDLQEEQQEKTRQAEQKAEMAEAALMQMMAERDALAAKVERLKQDGMAAAIREGRNAVREAAVAATTTAAVATAAMTSAPDVKAPAFVNMSAEPVVAEQNHLVDEKVEDDEEYEIVYVTEEELEEGEEYEIEYVDEEEYEAYQREHGLAADADEPMVAEVGKVQDTIAAEVEKIQETVAAGVEKIQDNTAVEEKTEEATDQIGNVEEQDANVDKQPETEEKAVSKEVEEAIEELEKLDKESEKVPVVPHFKKSESIASVPSEQIAKMATAITTEPKYSGLIGRAVKQREKAQLEETVKMVEEMPAKEKEEQTTQEPKSNSSDQKQKEDGAKEPEKKQDDDRMTDAAGNTYVQATMQFDEDFEIMEF